MKKIQLSILIIIFSIAANAQFYKFDYYSEAYSEFNDGTVLTDIFIEEVLAVSINKDLKTFNQPMNKDALQIGKNGYIVNVTNDYGFALDPLVASMISRDATSSISYKVEDLGAEGPLLKIQWKNMGLDGNDAGDYVNFQLFVYLSTQQIEFRYGPSNVTSTDAFGGESGPQILITLLTPDFQNFHEIQTIVGEGNMPEVLVGGYGRYTGVPDDGTVLRFRSRALLNVNKNTINLITVYPNPTSDVVNISGDFTGTEVLTIVNTVGVEVLRLEAIENRRQIDISDLKPGIYYIKIWGNDTLHLNTLIIIE